jgi:DNA repair exonuclease SbcCD ATPase subunit
MKTKKIYKMALAVVISSTMMTACNEVKQGEQDQLLRERDSLAALSNSQANTISEVNKTLGEISMMMDSINIQEDALILTNNDRSETPNYRERIKGNIRTFESLLKRQKERIAELEETLDDSNEETANLRNVIKLMKSQIEQKDREIQDLRAQLDESNKSILELKENVSSLNAINENQRSQISSQQETISSQEETLSAQDKKLNEGYYLVATKNELKDMGIKSGGNLFKKSKTNLNNLPTGKFKQVDIRNFRGLNIPGKKVTLISPAPPASYRLYQEPAGYRLVINDPTSFWSISNYLVIQTE